MIFILTTFNTLKEHIVKHASRQIYLNTAKQVQEMKSSSLLTLVTDWQCCTVHKHSPQVHVKQKQEIPKPMINFYTSYISSIWVYTL